MSRNGAGDSSLAIEATGLSVCYRLTRNPTTSIKQHAIWMLRRQIRYEQLWALRNVSFELRRGELLGVIGANGAGKSTLLKIVSRVRPPTSGRVIVRGTVAPMIELGAGFNPELTGYENIILYGALLGHEPQEMRARAREIAEWADLVDFLDVPIRSYSSGMLVRLAFSIATRTNPDVLLVDEVLAVGDEAFRERSTARISAMIEGGAAVMLVSHSLEVISAMATRAIWLDHGRMAASGPTQDVIDAYLADVASRPGDAPAAVGGETEST